MQLTANRNFIRWVIIISSFIIISLILWNTYIFFQNFKAEERIKMQTWSIAQSEIQEVSDLEQDISKLTTQVLETNSTTPMILLGSDNTLISSNNIPEKQLKDHDQIMKLVERFKNENTPIPIVIDKDVANTIYYGNSPLLNKLKYYPLALLLIIFLFGAVVYFFYRSSKNAAQNKLWSGMAKETAHQIGTPLSSLIGWTEILKSENVNPDYLIEIEKDVYRLQTITDRFSKIGSMPTLKPTNFVAATKESYDYLTARSSKLIDFEFDIPEDDYRVNLNTQLYSWTIENLVKNAIDAMKGKGKLKIEITSDGKFAHVLVHDTGKGIHKSQFRKIFEPGYTSKKRGWGLGLSLAKRIIEDYHEGKIKVVSSEKDIGTTMQISLKLI
ncbi:MAG: HAMP domain-containing histidine kinase [Flavobacteriaceae bacterium]|nr:HAMP domain-containing histidine kinase [Flavobacteriaceae bacterium]